MDYISEVANSLLLRSRDFGILGPEIYTMIAEWEKKEIPLTVVLMSIDDVCTDNMDAGGIYESIDKLRIAVGRNFRIWLVGHTAKKAA